MLEVPKVICPGFARASARKSFAVFTGREACTTATRSIVEKVDGLGSALGLSAMMRTRHIIALEM